MNKLRQAISIMLMVALCASGSSAMAAPVTPATQKYQETQLTIPADYAKNGAWRMRNLSVYGDKIHLVVEETGLDGALTYHHYQSANGGKQWQEQPMDWLHNEIKKYDKFRLDDAFITVGKDDAVYAMFDKQGLVETKTLTYGYYKAQLLKYQNGKTQEVFSLDNQDYNQYQPLGRSMAGEPTLVLRANGQNLEEFTGKKIPSQILVLDALTGKQKSAVPLQGKQHPLEYVDGRYVMWDTDGIAFYDVNTGRVLSKMKDLPSDEALMFGDKWAAGSNQTLYKMNANGLFRTEQYTAWEQVLDATVCKRGTAGSNTTSCVGLFEAEDGSIYVLLRHEFWNAELEKSEFKSYTFSRYTPA